MGERSAVRAFWEYLWDLDGRTRRAIRMQPTALLDRSALSDEERELADELASDGGRRSERTEGDVAGGDGDGDGGSDDDGSSFDIDDYSLRNRIGLVLGPLLFAAILLAPNPQGLSPAGQAVGATTAWVATWWITEAMPIPATSLLPIVLFPITGAVDIDTTTASYGDTYIFLFMGGFFIAMAMQRWGLHRRIALRTIKATGTSPTRIILGFMIATGFLSMWVSNTATTVMMTPIGLAVILQTRDLIEEQGMDVPTSQGDFHFGTGLMLCIAYAASIGGVGTIIGTPPNVILVGAIEATFGRSISFGQWMLYGVPIAVVGIAIVWVYVTKFLIPPRMGELGGGIDVIDEELAKLGSISREERLVLVVFIGAALAWILRSIAGEIAAIAAFSEIVTDDSIIAIAAALIMFVVPARTDDGSRTTLLDWNTALNIPWGVLLLFGGGLAIASGFETTGLAEWIGQLLSTFQGVSIALIIGLIVVLTIFLTEVTSNTATTAMLMPIMASLAVGLSLHPYAVMIGAATAASFAFMLPVATPPNAIVFGSGYISIPQMAKTGAGLNIIGVVLITLLTLTWLPFVWGIDVTRLPTWAGLLVGF
jgi:solute carrier family 13 (sodium-dependent dicarboxylate transporter), member 2/3/5